MEKTIITELVQAFGAFPFTLEEYSKDDGRTVSREAMSFLVERLPEVSGDVIHSFLHQAIRGRCLSLLTTNAEWKACPSEYCSSLKCTVWGKEISGHSIIEPKRIHVEMSNGNQTLTKDSSLHEWAPRIFTTEPYVGSPANEEGRRVAMEMFLLLFLESKAN